MGRSCLKATDRLMALTKPTWTSPAERGGARSRFDPFTQRVGGKAASTKPVEATAGHGDVGVRALITLRVRTDTIEPVMLKLRADLAVGGLVSVKLNMKFCLGETSSVKLNRLRTRSPTPRLKGVSTLSPFSVDPVTVSRLEKLVILLKPNSPRTVIVGEQLLRRPKFVVRLTVMMLSSHGQGDN